jgi:excinuclease ABC subunit B
MSSLFARRDVIVVASVSCIYGIGSKEDYEAMVVPLRVEPGNHPRPTPRKLVDLQYTRNDIEFNRGQFRVRGDTIEFPAYTEDGLRVEFFGERIERLTRFDPLTGHKLESPTPCHLPGQTVRHPHGQNQTAATLTIREELTERIAWFEQSRQTPRSPAHQNAHRIRPRDDARDGLLLRHRKLLTPPQPAAPPGSRPACPARFLPQGLSARHRRIARHRPQIGGMYAGDLARKTVLVEHGFRLPSALDNRPLNFDEFQSLQGQTIYVSATPADREIGLGRRTQVVELVVRPTGLVDPPVTVKPAPRPDR